MKPKPTNPKPAGERLKELREAKQLSKTAVGIAAECSRSAINLYESGKRVPNGPNAYRLYLLTKKWGAPILPTDWSACA